MQPFFNCCPKCRSNNELSMETAWAPGQINPGFENPEKSCPATAPEVISTQPYVQGKTEADINANNTASPTNDYVDIDFRKNSIINDDRFTDMAATIFKRNS